MFVVEEFVRALDLATRIRRTAPFTVPIAVEIMIGIVEGLVAVHQAGLVHGDLRPANVLVGSEWHVWLNGVGMRAVYRAEPILLTAHEARSVGYTAPELFRGSAPSAASDLYACGVIFYEMLTGSLPFVGDTPVLTAEAHLNEPIPPLRQRNPAVPRTVEGIITKCLQKEPNQRYESALKLLNDLKAVRDALRFGKPLGWSPIDLPGSESPLSVSGDLFARSAAKTASVSVAPPARQVREEEEDEDIPRWLRTMLRVMAALVVVAVIVGVAGWLALQWAPQDRPIPPVVGKELQEANRLLTEMGFEPEVRQEGYSEQYPPGVVYSVSPPEGRVVPKGSKVSLWVSKGSRFTVVPDVRNKPESQARSELERAGLAVADATKEQYSDTVPLGFVVNTVPPAGARVDRSNPVQLIISQGQGQTEETLPPPTTPQTSATMREFVIRVDLRDQPDRKVRIEVEDAEGKRTVYDELKAGGSLYEIPIQAQGSPVRIRVYIDDQLAQEIRQ
ncbi:MAG: PASTA domain-containing protein [Fimbriimonadales bacterium]